MSTWERFMVISDGINMRKYSRRWLLKNLPKTTLRFLAERVERLYFKGLSFEQAMNKIVIPMQRSQKIK